MSSFLDIQQAVYRDFGYADSPASDISARIKGYINDRHRRILSRPGMGILRQGSDTFSSTASKAVYALTQPVARLLKMVNQTQQLPLFEQSLDWYRTVDPKPTATTSTPQFWIPMGYSASLDLGGTSPNVYVVSTVAGDNTQSVHVEAFDVNGNFLDKVAALNGTTRVAVFTGSTGNVIRITRCFLTAVATGEIRLFDAAVGGNQINFIASNLLSMQNYLVALWPTPAAIETIAFDYTFNIRDFTQSYDTPALPLDYHYLVTLGAKMDEARKRDDNRAPQWEREYERGLVELLNYVANPPDMVVVPGSGTISNLRRSNLGPWFPSGVW